MPLKPHLSRVMVLVALVLFALLGARPALAGSDQFIDNNNGTVTDSVTGLIWDRCSWGQTGTNCTGTATILDWKAALKVAVKANTSNRHGHTDWRLPNYTELESLVDIKASSMPLIDKIAFPSTQSNWYWSSTLTPNGIQAWRITFYNGNSVAEDGIGIGIDDKRYVRLVRSEESFDSLAVKQTQTIDAITFSPETLAAGSTTTASATASSNLAVTFTSTTTDICAVSGTNGATITGVAVGTCTIAANQAGNGAYSAATEFTQDIAVSQGSQIITFGPAPSVTVGGTGTVSATGGASNNSVVFTSTTTDICTVSGSTITGVKVGDCTITANQAGNANYSAATAVTQDITVAQGTQATLTVTGLPATAVYGQTANATASGGSGTGGVTFSAGSSSVCTVGSTSGVVTITSGSGTCAITATKASDDNYLEATSAAVSITAQKADQTIGAISFSATTLAFNGTTTVSATGGESDKPVVFTSTTPDVCTVSGTNGETITGVAGGTCTIAANQAGNDDYNAATQVTQDITVTCPTNVVTTTADSGAGSLRQAIADACPNGTITFASDLAVKLTTATLLINKNLTIDGGDHTVSVNGPGAGSAPPFSVLTISAGQTVTLQNLTIANGQSLSGSGINNSGTLTLTNTTVSGNSSYGSGGGIWNSGQLTLNNSTVSGNKANSAGGIDNEGQLTLNNSIVSGNKAGGIRHGAGTLVLNNSTLSGNISVSPGGAIYSSAPATLTNVTIVGNRVGENMPGAGIFNASSTLTLTLRNTLLANNTAAGAPANCGGSIAKGGNNLDDGETCGFKPANGSLSNAAPLLGTLGDYGGTTQTIPLLPGSPAIGAGKTATCAAADTVNGRDQRGVTRPQGTGCDIGAFESQGFTFAKSGDSQSATISTAFADPLKVTVTPTRTGDPVDGGKVTFTAPNTGASATLATSPATITSGAASVTATANAIAGSYSVTASAAGATTASFSLNNALNGVCGTANDQALTSTPSGAALCTAGTASNVSGSGPWSWSCAGSDGGTNASCLARIQTYTATASATTGGTISPASQTLNHGSSAVFTLSSQAGYGIASASGCGGTLNGNRYTISALTADCTVSANFTANAVAGVCGADNGRTLTSAPTTNLCASGSASTVSGSGPWNWSCDGTGGGGNASCATAAGSYLVSTSFTAAEGSLSPASRTVTSGGITSFTVTPAAEYAINAVTDTCSGSGTLTGNLFTTGAVTAACTVSATFTSTNTTTVINGVSPTPSKIGDPVAVNYTVTGADGLSGTVTVSDQDGVTCSSTVTAGAGATTASGSCNLTTFTTSGAKTLIASYSGTANASASAGTNHLVADVPTLATPSLNSGVVGVPYAMQLVASGGYASTASPYVFTATGLPSGFSLSTTGLLSGTGSAAATSSVAITVTDGLSQSSTTTLPLALVNQLTVATTSLPDGLVNAPYVQTLDAVGGQTPYVWSVTAGSLPAGLSLEDTATGKLSDTATGKLSGTPTTLGTSASFTLKVTDAANRTAEQALTLTTAEPTVVETGNVGVGGKLVTVAGNLTPDGGGNTCAMDDQQTLVLNVTDLPGSVSPPLSTTLPYGLFKLTVQGCTPGATQLTVKLVYPDALPSGTRYWKYGKTADNQTNHWYVLPTAIIDGNTVTFTITDGGLGDDDLTADGSITDPGGPGGPTFAISGTPGNGQVGSAYSATLIGNGVGPYNWSLAGGNLPPGVTLNTANGALSGTPTQVGTFGFTAQLMDTGNANVSTTKTLGITIAAASGGGGGGGGGVTPITGVCGSAHNGLFYDLPTNSSVLCISGTASAINGTGPWTWSCLGSNGGSTASCQADRVMPSHTVTVTATASAGGTIAPPSQLVKSGETATFTLAPASGYAISSVSGCGGTLSGSTYTTGVITGACAVSATFSANPLVNLTVRLAGSGQGQVISQPAGIDCGVTCVTNFVRGTEITLTATPKAGELFGGWSGECKGAQPTCTLTLDQNREATASFLADQLGSWRRLLK